MTAGVADKHILDILINGDFTPLCQNNSADSTLQLAVQDQPMSTHLWWLYYLG